MSALLATLLCVATAAPPAVVVLPLSSGPGVTATQARGVTAQLRSAFEGARYAKLLPERRDDDETAKSCRRGQGKNDGECLREAAESRGADLLATGFVRPVDDGLEVVLVVVGPTGPEVLRRAHATLTGSNVAFRLDQLLRQAFAPQTLEETSVVPVDDDAVPLPTAQRDLTGPLVTGGVAVGALALGAVAGALSLRDSFEVSDKAKAQNLAFPDDEGLVVRGQALMWTANGLFLAGALAAAGAATWWALLPPGESEP